MSTLLRRLPRVPLAAGALLLALGLGAALRWLPEWRADPSRAPELLRGARERLALVGARLSGAKLVLATGETDNLAERAYRRLGPAGADWLLASGVAAGVRIDGTLEVPGAGTGPVGISLAADGSIRSLKWLPGGSVFELAAPDARAAAAREAFAARLVTLLAGNRPTGAESSTVQGNVTLKTVPIVGSAPPEAVVRTIAPNAIVSLAREPADPDAPLRFGGTRAVQKAFLSSVPVIVLVLATFSLFAWLLFRHRVSPRIAAPLAGLAAASMLVGGLAPQESVGGAFLFAVTVAGRLASLGFLFVLWVVAESMLRDTVPGFTTSLDSFAAGRLSPRGGNAVLAGLGIGAAVAGLRLATLAFAAERLAPDVRPTALSFFVPFLSGTRSPFFEGPYDAACFVLLVALFRFVLPRGMAGSAAALLFALFISLEAPLAPWGAGFALCLGISILFLESFRRYGFAALLVTTTSAALLRDVAASGRIATHAFVPFAFAALALAAIAAVGLVALARPEREDEGRVAAPEYIQRVESERRVKCEMDLLSRMQLAMLPDHPPQVAGLDLAVRTLLATEAGGDLYEFIEDDGQLWIAAGDVSGHGYSCGIQGAMVKAALLSLARDGRTPGAVLAETDRVLRAAKAGRLFTSLALLKLDPRTGTGLLANAGHPYPILVAEGKCREVQGSGLPLGQGPPRTYADLPVQIPEGGSLVFASDGLYEGPDRFDEPYGYQRPCAVLESIGLWRRPAEAIVEALFADWRDHVGAETPADDTTVLVVKRPALAW